MNIIEIRNLTKKFGEFTAVDSMNLDVKEGEIFGFLGPNGAGKTTSISMLTTLIRPTSGKATIAGYDLSTEGHNIRSVIGVVPQQFALFPELTAEENLSYIGKLYGMTRTQIKERSDYLLKTVSLYTHRHRQAGVFSGGMKQRLSLAASIISRPKILFMDEPTTGLDPQSRITMRELTRKLNSQGMTIIYTTHDMDEAEKLCDRITIIDKGTIVANGTADELKRMTSELHWLEIKVHSPSKNLITQLKKLPFITKSEQEGEFFRVAVKNRETAFHNVSEFLHKQNQHIEEMRFKEVSLEEVFIHLTKKDLRD